MSTIFLNQENIIKKVYDPATETLKVNAIATISPGILEITITDVDDSIKIGDGTGNFLDVNPDGSLNVTIVGQPVIVGKNIYTEILSVGTAILTPLVMYVVPSGKTAKIVRVNVSGTNIATYDLSINGIIQAKKRTMFGDNLNTDFTNSINLVAGDVVLVRVINPRPYVGDYNGTIQVEEI